MADSALFTQLAGLQKSVQQSLGTLVKVTLHTADIDIVDPVTGEFAFRDSIVDARIEGSSGIRITSSKDTPSDSLKISIYDPEARVTENDYITWNDVRYKVLSVDGLVKNAMGERYIYKCKVGS